MQINSLNGIITEHLQPVINIDNRAIEINVGIQTMKTTNKTVIINLIIKVDLCPYNYGTKFYDWCDNIIVKRCE